MVRTDILHRQVAPVKANEHGSLKIVSGTPQERPGGKNELRAMIGKSTKFRQLRSASQCLLRELINRAGDFGPDESGAEILHVQIYADDNGRRGQQVLADAIGRCVKTVQRSLVELAEAGLVVAQQRPGWRYRLHSYTVVVPQEIIAEYRQQQAARKQRKVSRSSRQTVAAIATDCREHGDKMSLSSCSSAFSSAHKEETTTTNAPNAKPMQPASTHAARGGGDSSQSTGEAKAEAMRRVREVWHVESWPSIAAKLDRGQITVDEIMAVDRHALHQDNAENIGGGLFRSWLVSPDYAEDRRVWVEEWRAEKAKEARREAARIEQERIDREASAKRHRLWNAISAAGVAANRTMSERPEAVEQIQKNIALIGRMLGKNAQEIAERLTVSQRVDIVTLAPDPVFKRLANIANENELQREKWNAERAQEHIKQETERAERDRIAKAARDEQDRIKREALAEEAAQRRAALHKDHIWAVNKASDIDVGEAWSRARAGASPSLASVLAGLAIEDEPSAEHVRNLAREHVEIAAAVAGALRTMASLAQLNRIRITQGVAL